MIMLSIFGKSLNYLICVKRIDKPDHVHDGTWDLEASSTEFPASACSVDPCGLFSNHGVVQVNFPLVFKLPVERGRKLLDCKLTHRISNSDISFCQFVRNLGVIFEKNMSIHNSFIDQTNDNDLT
ncbi:hypothetical protein HELRODRAFT_158513 [Helobdella robusta]|uniref:Uncharacterized protein n=1 Tax=Helobdella robusta TaxID=6412 RepID=T1EMW1_HELRO|nr:hypothetical protein HELRODRAFT_158513 [Helobdella robusta]ESO12091.1 hypothetical protein HELRODRAFT_158513 [Helobdella robusta]